MSKNKLFIIFALGGLLGVCLTNILFIVSISIGFLSINLLCVLVLIIFVKKYKGYVMSFGVGIFLGTCLSIYHNIQVDSQEQFISHYANQTLSFSGKIQELNKQDIDKKSYIAECNVNGRHINGLLYFRQNEKVEIGDTFSLNGKMILPENNGNFNYIKYLQTKNVYFIVYYGNYIPIGETNKGYITTHISDIQSKLHNIIFEMYPENEAGLLAGLLFGEKTSLSPEINTNFSNSGLSHIISVSGFNITIIIIFLGYLFGFIPPIFRSLIITVFVVFFTLLVGYGLPVLRASIMGLLGYYILLAGRKGESLSLLLLSAVIMIAWNPYYLNYDLSFEMSFLAVLGLYYTEPFFKKLFFFVPKYLGIKESLVLTMSALSTTIPITIFNFGQVSLIAPIANILAGAVIPITMLFGFISILGQYLSHILGYYLGYGEFYLLQYILSVAEYCGNLPYATFKVDLGGYAGYFEILYFGILIFLILYFRKKSPTLTV